MQMPYSLIMVFPALPSFKCPSITIARPPGRVARIADENGINSNPLLPSRNPIIRAPSCTALGELEILSVLTGSRLN
ncbi:hypothetical protein BDV19DRAFT_374948 [Aspergillus venezuelensis]